MDIFVGAKLHRIELKTETFQWEQTGNIAIEYRRNGLPSGIATTDGDLGSMNSGGTRRDALLPDVPRRKAETHLPGGLPQRTIPGACRRREAVRRRASEVEGHSARMMPPACVKPYIRREKNDAADAAAICEAVTPDPISSICGVIS